MAYETLIHSCFILATTCFILELFVIVLCYASIFGILPASDEMIRTILMATIIPGNIFSLAFISLLARYYFKFEGCSLNTDPDISKNRGNETKKKSTTDVQ
jgi:hypothetical protein